MRQKEREGGKKCRNMKVEINALGETLNADKPWVKWLLFYVCPIRIGKKGFIQDRKTCRELNAIPKCNSLGVLDFKGWPSKGENI